MRLAAPRGLGRLSGASPEPRAGRCAQHAGLARRRGGVARGRARRAAARAAPPGRRAHQPLTWAPTVERRRPAGGPIAGRGAHGPGAGGGSHRPPGHLAPALGRRGPARRPTARVFDGATDGQAGPHAEVVALRAAGAGRAAGATLVCTLEPCSHWGRTPPCADALIEAGVRRVVVGHRRPRPEGGRHRHRPAAGSRGRGDRGRPGRGGRGAARGLPPPAAQRTALRGAEAGGQRSTVAPPRRTARAAGSPVPRPAPTPTCCGPRATPSSSAPARCGRRPGPDRAGPRPALGRPAPQGRPATGRPRPAPRRRPGPPLPGAQRRRCPTCSTSSAGAAASSCWWRAAPAVAAAFHRAGLVDRYVLYLAPALFGGDDAARPVLGARERPRSPTLWRGRLLDVRRLGGGDVRLDLVPRLPGGPRRDRCERHVAWCRAGGGNLGD